MVSLPPVLGPGPGLQSGLIISALSGPTAMLVRQNKAFGRRTALHHAPIRSTGTGGSACWAYPPTSTRHPIPGVASEGNVTFSEAHLLPGLACDGRSRKSSKPFLSALQSFPEWGSNGPRPAACLAAPAGSLGGVWSSPDGPLGGQAALGALVGALHGQVCCVGTRKSHRAAVSQCRSLPHRHACVANPSPPAFQHPARPPFAAGQVILRFNARQEQLLFRLECQPGRGTSLLNLPCGPSPSRASCHARNLCIYCHDIVTRD